MDILSILGLILAVGMVLFGIMFDSDTTRVVLGNLHAFWDYPSLAITIGGTIGVMMLSFPPSAFKKIGKHMQIIFRPQKFDPRQSIQQIVELATEARMKGLLSLEDKLNEINSALDSISKAEQAEALISKLPDTVGPDDTDDEKLINQAKEQHDALTDYKR